MTPITATLHTPTLIRLDFRYDKATVETVKALKGAAFVNDGKFWTVPIRMLDALAQTVGANLDIHPDVLEAKIASDMARVRIFVANLLAAGISLDVIGGKVTGSGGAYCADPWQKEIDARAEAIVSLGLQHSKAPEPVAVPAPMLDYEPVTADVMRQAELLVTGMRNAVREEQKAQTMAGKRRKYAKVTP